LQIILAPPARASPPSQEESSPQVGCPPSLTPDNNYDLAITLISTLGKHSAPQPIDTCYDGEGAIGWRFQERDKETKSAWYSFGPQFTAHNV